MFKRIRNNIKYIRSRFSVLTAMAFGLISTLQMFVGWDIFGIKEENVRYKILILIALLIACAVISVIWAVFLSNEVTIFKKDDVEIIVKYDDLMKIAFPKKHKDERIVVIATNRCFDTVVDQNLIRDRSVHGQFLQRFANDDTARGSLDSAIEASMQEFGIAFEMMDRTQKRYGKLKRYPLGSVARITGNNGVTFFLLALTEFDVDCVAHCDKHQYVDCLLKLFEYYNAHGQGRDLYLYPMGTSMARTGLSKKEALEATTVLTKISKDNLRAKTTIVVNKNDKNDISITDIS